MGKRAGKLWKPETRRLFTVVKAAHATRYRCRIISERDYQKLLRLAKNRGNGK